MNRDYSIENSQSKNTKIVVMGEFNFNVKRAGWRVASHAKADLCVHAERVIFIFRTDNKCLGESRWPSAATSPHVRSDIHFSFFSEESLKSIAVWKLWEHISQRHNAMHSQGIYRRSLGEDFLLSRLCLRLGLSSLASISMTEPRLCHGLDYDFQVLLHLCFGQTVSRPRVAKGDSSLRLFTFERRCSIHRVRSSE